jgi:hypothetical protein
MKRNLTSTEEKRNFSNFEQLNQEEMLQVRGGGDKGDTRDRDIFDFD